MSESVMLGTQVTGVLFFGVSSIWSRYIQICVKV